jgi:hypothetical protein
MNDAEIEGWLRGRGCPAHVVRGGRAHLINAWKRFVSKVERGYDLTLDDYRNDLDIRTLIAHTGLASEVRDEDERFRALLTATDREIWTSDAPDPFWIYGYPRNARGELLEDLRAEGVA